MLDIPTQGGQHSKIQQGTSSITRSSLMTMCYLAFLQISYCLALFWVHNLKQFEVISVFQRQVFNILQKKNQAYFKNTLYWTTKAGYHNGIVSFVFSLECPCSDSVLSNEMLALNTCERDMMISSGIEIL